MTDSNTIKHFGRGILFVNEFGNGFVNLEVKNETNTDKNNTLSNITVYIPKDKLYRAYNFEEVEIEYYKSSSSSNDPSKALYNGRVINYTLKNKQFIGLVHHIYKDEVFIYTTELKTANLIRIKTLVYLQKNTWVIVTVTDDSEHVCGDLTEVLPNSINDVLAAKYNLTQLDTLPTPSTNSISSIIPKPTYEIIDQTHLETFTIDPPNSLDCDDAFSIELLPNSNSVNIYVHIANVAYWFNPTTPLWESICNRGTTFYGINGKNWSMLPPNYANGICSILPNQETQVLTCEFIYSLADKQLQFVKFYPSKVISKFKYDYDTFDTLLLDIPDIPNIPTPNDQTHRQYQILLDAAKSIRTGYNDFIFGNETPAHWLVRYWMLHVNTVMCRTIYRYNAIPDDNKQKTIARYIHHKYAGKYFPSSRTYDILTRENLVLICNENQTNDNVLSYLGKTAMLKSFYTTDVEMNYHYGIGKTGYTHWTSPIRRLPDLLNHCLLLGYVIPEEELQKWIKISNLAELKQDQIEKFIIMWKNAEKNKTGDMLDGIIIGVMKTGIMVYIDSLGSKYTIHISKLGSARLEFNGEQLFNDTAKVSFALFDTVRLRISKIFFDVIEFDLVI
jgi:ribonuclease R